MSDVKNNKNRREDELNLDKLVENSNKLSSKILAHAVVSEAFMTHYFLSHPDGKKVLRNFTDSQLSLIQECEKQGKINREDFKQIELIFEDLNKRMSSFSDKRC